MSMLGSSPESGILRTRSLWNAFEVLPRCMPSHSVFAHGPSCWPLAAPDSSDAAPLAPADCHRACAPPDDELLVDSCFDRGDGEAGERWENVVEPVRLDAGDVGERL